jgi:diguanylate cyclase (GGDEF)-like protein
MVDDGPGGIATRTVDDARIGRITAEFLDRGLEHAFRRANVDADARRLGAVTTFGVVIAPSFSIPDLIQQGPTHANLAILSMQCLVALSALWVVIRLHQQPSSVMSHGPTTFLSSVAMASALLSLYLRPAQTMFVQVTFCILVAAIFMFVPNRFVPGLVVNGVGLAGLVAISVFAAPPAYRSDVKVVMGLATLAGLCGFAGNALARGHRVAFAEVVREQRANTRLAAEIERRRELEDELTWLADHDSLSDALNRRAFFERAELLTARARSRRDAVSVLMIDADRFKAINDEFGHQTGDEAIRTIAGLCRSCVRTDDLVGRIGGEEFAILLPAAPLRVAEEIAGRIRERIALHAIEHPNGPVCFTVSIGIAESPPGRDLSVQDLLQRADRAMYDAKAAGRDRVLTAPSTL